MKATLTPDVLRELAGPAAFKRGKDYAAAGRVVSLAEDRGRIAAEVQGTQTYYVEVRIRRGSLAYACTCPVGEDGECCKHCVAAALAWLEDSGRSRSGKRKHKQDPLSMNDVRAHLARMPRKALIDMLVDNAIRDERLRQRLLLEAATRTSGGVNVETYRKAINGAMRTGGVVDYHAARGYARRIHDVVDSIEPLLPGHAEAVIELSEHALRKTERAIEYVDDSDGYVGEILRRLQSLHLAACEIARPDPRALARKLAEQEWSRVPVVGPGEEDPDRWGKRFHITRIMETLAAQSGDVDQVVAVMQRDLSMPHDYLRIADAYEQAGRQDDARDWAERGIKAFPRPHDPRLLEFLAKAYHGLKRHGDAMKLAWEGFLDSPTFDAYQALERHASVGGDWPSWREKALAVMRENAARTQRRQQPDEWYWFSRPDGSELVRVFLWEEDIDAAWHAANAGGCSADLWLDLARQRERDHPGDAIRVYQERVERVLERKNSEAYAEAADLLRDVARLMRQLERGDELDAYLSSVRAKHKAKRNFIKLIAGIGF